MHPIVDFSEQVAGILAALHSNEFAPRLVRLLSAITVPEEVSVLAYLEGRFPVADYFDSVDVDGANANRLFIDGAFLLDPYYLAASRRDKQGFFHLRELVDTGFRHSEYFKSYFRASGFSDEAGYLVQLGDTNFVNVSLIKIGSGSFSPRELAQLQALDSLVRELVKLHWHGRADHPEPGSLLRSQLEAALEDFGSSMLTARECENINLLLRGYSTRSISASLGISQDTVKLHRKNAYAKLGVGSQAELFHMFIDSLRSMKVYVAGDPLVHYLGKPGQT